MLIINTVQRLETAVSKDIRALKFAAGRTFRKLSKNHVYQTTDQWKERTLQRLGETSGQRTAWVEEDDIPTVPMERPRAPDKPTTEALALPLKQTIPERRLLQLQEEEAKRKPTEGKTQEPKTIEAIPIPTDCEALSEYEELNGRYERLKG